MKVKAGKKSGGKIKKNCASAKATTRKELFCGAIEVTEAQAESSAQPTIVDEQVSDTDWFLDIVSGPVSDPAAKNLAASVMNSDSTPVAERLGPAVAISSFTVASEIGLLLIKVLMT